MVHDALDSIGNLVVKFQIDHLFDMQILVVRNYSVEAFALYVGPITPEKPAVVAGTADHPGSPQVHHQITVTAANIGTTTDGRCVARRNSFRRSSSWAVDPKRVLFFFATL